VGFPRLQAREDVKRAPDREVDAGVAERVRHRARGVRRVEPRVRARLVGGLGDPSHVEQLPGAVQRGRHEDDPDVVVRVERGLDIARVDRPPVAALDDAELLVRVDPALAELRADRVVVGGEVELVDEDGGVGAGFPVRRPPPVRRRDPLSLRAVAGQQLVEEGADQGVEVHRDRVADDDLRGVGADEGRERVAEPLADREPRRVGVGPPAD